MERCRIRFALVLLVALAAVGAHGGSAVAAVAAAESADGYQTKTVASADVTISFPRGWTVVPITEREVQKSRNRLAKQDPQLAARFDDAARTQIVEAVRFRAADLNTERYRPGIAVATLDFDYPAPAEFSILRGQFQTAGFTVLDTSRPKFGSGKGYRIDLSRPLTMPDGSSLPVRLSEFIVPGGDGMTIIAMVTEDTPDGSALIDDLLSRIRRA